MQGIAGGEWAETLRGRAQAYPRIVGCLALLVGGCFAKIFLLDPIAAVNRGATSVSISMKGVFLSIYLCFLGLLLVTFGTTLVKAMNRQQDERTRFAIAAVVGATLGIATIVLVVGYLRSKGFSIQ